MYKRFSLLHLVILFLSIPCLAAQSLFQVSELKVEYIAEPLGIDVETPRFSWQMISDIPGSSQKAYQLIVTDEHHTEVWNTGRVKSDISLNIEYAGQALKPRTRYQWTVHVWNQKNKLVSARSWFETGLMCAGQKYSNAWNDAQWIGGSADKQVLYAHYFSVFKINYTVQLDSLTQPYRVGFIYGANDQRLMDANMNLHGVVNLRDSSYVKIELDASSLPARLNIYRLGYTKEDKPIAIVSEEIPLSVINEKNRFKKHRFYLHSNNGITDVFINKEDHSNRIVSTLLNPYGWGGDFFSYPVLADLGIQKPLLSRASISDVEIRHFREPSNLILKIDSLHADASEKTALIDPSRNSMPMLRTNFKSESKKIQKARLYVTARGVYDFYINGKRIHNDYFNPGLTQYNKTHMYQTFDVTPYVYVGKNAMGAILGEGWWSGGSTYMPEKWNFFGDRQSLLAQLVLTYEDGKEQTIVTTPDLWQYSNEGPVIYSSFFQGEVYDARKEQKNWSTIDCDLSNWSQCVEIALENHVFPFDYSDLKLIGQISESVNPVTELTAISVKEVRPGVFIYDMGQNFAGVSAISLSGMKPGQRITMRYAEVKYPDLPRYEENIGMIMLENIRAAMAQNIYICKGGKEVVSPRFTFQGYRFVEITGIEEALPLEAVKAVVLSSVDRLASHYETSNKKVNRLWENIVWSTYSNFLSVPTDCPQRNERMGWSGDISVFSETATYLIHAAPFLNRHLLSMRDSQRPDGRFADVSPMDEGFGGLLWGSAGITVAWQSYLQYDDKAMLTAHYDAMKRYIRFVLDNYIDPDTHVIVQRRAGSDLGDWLSLEYDKNDRSLLWEAYFLYQLEIMQKVAVVLDEPEDAQCFAELYKQRKEFFNQTYIHPENGKTISSGYRSTQVRVPAKGAEVDTQTSYVLPLAFDIVNQESKALFVDNFLYTLSRNNRTDQGVDCPPYSLMTGFIGTAWINKALSENLKHEEAYHLLQQSTYPSWLYPVDQGATTIWERLNSYTHVDGFGNNNRMNSFNHYSFGAVGAWMYEHSLGIQRIEDFPGFKHFVLAPEIDPTGEMTYAYGHYDSMYGRIESRWEIVNNQVIYEFVVPANTTATLYIPASYQLQNKKTGRMKKMGTAANKAVLLLQSGRYSFVVPCEH